MTRSLVGLILWLLSSGVANAQMSRLNTCIDNFTATVTAGTTQAVPAILGQRIGLCGWLLDAASGAPPIVQLVYGTGTNCAIGTTPFTTPIAIPSNGFFLDHQQGVYMQTPVGQALCVQATGNGSIGVAIYWVQY
jgi:hypothetical protein